MEDLTRVQDSLAKLHDKIDDNTKTLIINTQDLKHHIKRTDMLEIEVSKTEVKVDQIEKSMIRLTSPFIFLKKTLVVCGIVVAIGAAIFKFL